MITARCYRDDQQPELVDPSNIGKHVDEDDGFLWVDVQDPSDDDLQCIQEQFHLHPLAMEDVREAGQRAKLEQYPTHAFIVAYSRELAEVDVFVTPGWLISVREKNLQGQMWTVKPAVERFERTRRKSDTSGFLLYTLLDTLVDGYFDASDEAEERLEQIEDRIFAERLADERTMQEELFALRRELVLFRRAVVPLREVVGSLLRREVEWLDEPTIVHLQDVYDHVLRMIDLLDSGRELLGNAVDAHLAIISNRMNQVMKTMTSWGAILLGSTLVAGIYGMNFKNMPELGWRMGYQYALGLMVLITVVGFIYFRRKDWL